MPALLLIRYGELALKSPPVRREFEGALKRNILEQFAAASTACRLRADHGHLYLETDEAESARRLLRRVVGVTSVSEVWEVPTDRRIIQERLLALAEPRLVPGASFAVRARRTGQHAFSSQELARDLGGDVLARWPERGLRVDLDTPEVELFVEVRGPRTYLYFDRASGPGGLPLGVAGRVVAFVDGPRGALGAYLMMKRGCRCALVATSEGDRLAGQILRRFDPKATVSVTELELATPAMQRAVESVRADGVVLPLTVEDYPAARATWGEHVVFSPTVGLTDEEVESRWQHVAELAS